VLQVAGHGGGGLDIQDAGQAVAGTPAVALTGGDGAQVTVLDRQRDPPPGQARNVPGYRAPSFRTRCVQSCSCRDSSGDPRKTRFAQVPGISQDLARSIIAETGLDMSRFPDAAHLVSWAGLCPRAHQSGTRARTGKKGRGNGYLRGYLGQAAIGAAVTATFLGERYHRVARRRGKAKAQVAVARSILVIIWHLLASPEARFTDLGCGYYQARTDKDRKIKNHIRQIEALLGHPDNHRQARITHTVPDQARPP
jgi:hypothetical protein